MITQSELKEYLHYNPESGIFVWAKTSSNRCKKGNIAGWYDKDKYICITINKRKYKSHRLAWLYVYGKFPDNQIDHINHVKSDNNIDNLRAVSSSENMKNIPLLPRNKTGITGVYLVNSGNSWAARITVNGKIKHLIQSKNKNDVIIARKMAEYNHGFHANHGE